MTMKYNTLMLADALAPGACGVAGDQCGALDCVRLALSHCLAAGKRQLVLKASSDARTPLADAVWLAPPNPLPCGQQERQERSARELQSAQRGCTAPAIAELAALEQWVVWEGVIRLLAAVGLCLGGEGVAALKQGELRADAATDCDVWPAVAGYLRSQQLWAYGWDESARHGLAWFAGFAMPHKVLCVTAGWLRCCFSNNRCPC